MEAEGRTVDSVIEMRREGRCPDLVSCSHRRASVWLDGVLNEAGALERVRPLILTGAAFPHGCWLDFEQMFDTRYNCFTPSGDKFCLPASDLQRNFELA